MVHSNATQIRTASGKYLSLFMASPTIVSQLTHIIDKVVAETTRFTSAHLPGAASARLKVIGARNNVTALESDHIPFRGRDALSLVSHCGVNSRWSGQVFIVDK